MQSHKFQLPGNSRCIIPANFTWTANMTSSRFSLTAQLFGVSQFLAAREAIKGCANWSAQTANEVRLMHLASNTLIAAMNTRVDGKPTDSTAG